MKIEFKLNQVKKGNILSLVEYLESSSNNWLYEGMNVEIDPTVDFKNQNVLIRWFDIDEGFNDKIIVNSLKEFKSKFSLK